MECNLTHFDENGKARMVDVSDKKDTNRTAIAEGKIRMKPETLAMIKRGQVEKGDVLGVARVAGIMAAKKASDIIPMCHPIIISGCSLNFKINDEESFITIEAEAKTTGKTGIEMEVLTAVSASALTIYDMCKAVDRGMIIENIHLLKKNGGKSGEWIY
ncbi:molybdenum cofactor biosynthesis protein [Clostridiales bacterium oral taxon 876 str. F0540]|nr:molybdenum cofactor biosynthesis protein [Clostridiales bacterium oral taxon 876 str. F0540]